MRTDPFAAQRAASAARVAALDTELVAGLQRSDLSKLPKNLGAWDKAAIYANGCHSSWTSVVVRPCAFGDVESARTVVLAGDSHAAHLQPALDVWATKHGWRLVSITKAGCPFVDVRAVLAEASQLHLGLPYRACDTWRAAATATIVELAPDVVVLPLLSRRGLTEPGRLTAWQRGITTAVTALRDTSQVVVLGDDPQVGTDIPACLRRTRDPRRCVIPYDEGVLPERIAAERSAAVAAGASFVDISSWFCLPAGCPAVAGRFVVRRDDNHVAAAFARHLWPRFDAVIDPYAHEPANSRGVVHASSPR